MTYLELCQRAVREAGTISGDSLPATVISQTGKLRKLVDWVSTAWNNLQLLHDDWRWMRAEGSGVTVASTARYTAASLALPRLGEFITEPGMTSIYLTATGVSDETVLVQISWSQYRQVYGLGSQTNDRPTEYAISPAGELCLGPIPDAIYTIKFSYHKLPQVLALDADVPELPGGDANHMLIVWDALILFHEFDEATLDVSILGRRRRELMDNLTRKQRGGGEINVTFNQGAGRGPIA